MVKYYLQMVEINGGVSDPNPPQQFIVYVSNKEEAIEKKEQFASMFNNKPFKAHYVECRHEEGESCISEELN